MKNSDIPRSRDTLFKIFGLIETLHPKQQLDLAAELASERLPSLLFQLVIDLPENRRLQLLEDLKLLTLGQRVHPRRECSLAVDYIIGERVYHNFVRDISESGVFVRHKGPGMVGDEILQQFFHTDNQIPFKFTGEIVRMDKDGIGIRFKDLSQYQKDVLQSIFDNAK